MARLRLVLVTDRRATPELSLAVKAALAVLPRGAAAVQVREKDLPARALLALVESLLPACRAFGAPLLVNDRADVALATGADGVHLPEAGLPPVEARALLGPDRLLGVSCHSPEGVLRAARGGADFALFAPVWAVPGKGPAQGLEGLRAACRAAPLPVYALGGVTAENAHLTAEAGAAGVACIRAVLGAPDPAAAAIALWQAVNA